MVPSTGSLEFLLLLLLTFSDSFLTYAERSLCLLRLDLQDEATSDGTIPILYSSNSRLRICAFIF